MNKINYFQLEMKTVEIKEWIIKIKWFASTPDIDRYQDIVNPKAFKSALETYLANPVVLLQHNSDKIIWKSTEAILSTKWLKVTVELSNDIDNVFKNIENWILKWFSIWFIAKAWWYRMEWDKEIREITDLDLIEISVVSTPANPNSLFTLTKSLESFFNNINLETMNKKITEEKDIEEIKDTEVVEKETEVTEEVPEAIEEWTNLNEVITWVENAVEIPATVEAPAENVEVKQNDEVITKINTELQNLKKDYTDLKEFVTSLLDWFLELSEKTVQIKSTVDAIPVRKWLANINTVEQKKVDPFYASLMEAKNKF